MTKNALIICNFRLRNIDEFNEILLKFKGSKYDIFDIGEIDRENFKIEILEQKIDKINKNNNGYENITVISNIRDVIFIWYRVYNKLIDNFIFFLDKVNYSILKRADNSEVLEEIAEFKGVYQEELKGKIYTNIDYNNYEQMFEFLFKNFKFRYFDSLMNIEYFNKNRNKESKKNIKKNYILKDKKISFGNGIQEEDVELSVEREEEKNVFFDLIDNSKYFYPFYSLFIIKNYSGNEAREILVKCYEKYEKADDNTKEEIAELIVNTKGFEKLNFKEKIGLLSINFGIDVKKNRYTTTAVLKEIIEDNGENAQTYYHIFNNFNLKHCEVDGKYYFENKKKAMILADDYYKKNVNLEYSYFPNSNKIMFIIDSLESKSYSGTKLLLDIIDNMVRIKENIEILIYSEENFCGIQDENPMIFDFNYRTQFFSDSEHKIETMVSDKYKNVKVIFSDIYNKKEERINDIIEKAKHFSPEVILTTTIASNSINILFEIFPIIHLSLGGVNSINKFDLYLFPHLEFIKKLIELNGVKYNQEIMIPFDYTGEFNESCKEENREKFDFDENDFILITVGVRIGSDISAGLAKVISQFIKEKKNVKWMLVGDTIIPEIDKYSEINNNILKIKYLSNLAEIYKMSNLYINPIRNGGGFSIAEAIINGLCVLSPNVSPAGVLHCGKENCVDNLDEFKRELYKLYEDKNYMKEKLSREKLVQEGLKLSNNISKLFNYIDKAKKNYYKRKG